MKFIPLFKVTDMRKAIHHYTVIMDFVMTCPNDTQDSPVVDLGHEETELQITTIESDRLFGSIVYVYVEDVDAMFKKLMDRGLGLSSKGNSPVHLGPVNQTWGRREFYVTDEDGNTIRFCKPII